MIREIVEVAAEVVAFTLVAGSLVIIAMLFAIVTGNA